MAAMDIKPSFSRIAVVEIGVRTGPRDLPPDQLSDWTDGPLTLALADPHRSVTADRATRATYLEEHMVRTILGADRVAARRRWRRVDWERSVGDASTVLWAVELLQLPDFFPPARQDNARSSQSRAPDVARYAVILHAAVEAPASPLADTMQGIRNLGSDLQDPLLASLKPCEDRGRSDVFRLVMACTTNGSWPRLAPVEVSEGKVQAHWLFHLASATLPRALASGKVPDFECDDETLERDLSKSTFAPSADWRVGVLRSGCAFIGRRADQSKPSRRPLWAAGVSVAKASDPFYDHGELYLHTIYSDAVLLGMAQRYGLRDLRSETLRAVRSEIDVTEARQLDANVFRYREQYWWTDASRGGVGDRLLQAFQDQHGLPAILEQVATDSASVSNRVQESAQRQISGTLAALTLLSYFAFCLTLARIFMPDHMPVSVRVLAVVYTLVPSVAVIVGWGLWRRPELLRTVREGLSGSTNRSRTRP